jgi:hypothetical protein
MLSINLFALTVLLCAGCGNGHSAVQAHLHEHGSPHGGLAVAFGDDYQIEWVLDAHDGKIQAYVLDNEMEKFVRISPPSFDVAAKLPGREEVLHFMAIANPATGETVGSTSLFEAQAEWLKTNKTFAAVVREINVEGTAFSNVPFNFVAGNAPDEKAEK